MVTVMVMNDLLPTPCSMSIGPPILRFSYFKIWPRESFVKAMRVVKGKDHIRPWKGQGHGQVQTIGHIWGLEFNRYVCFSFHVNRTVLAEISQIQYLTLKIQCQGHGQGQTRWSHLRPWWKPLAATWVMRCALVGAMTVPLLPDAVWPGESSGTLACPDLQTPLTQDTWQGVRGLRSLSYAPW